MAVAAAATAAPRMVGKRAGVSGNKSLICPDNLEPPDDQLPPGCAHLSQPALYHVNLRRHPITKAGPVGPSGGQWGPVGLAAPPVYLPPCIPAQSLADSLGGGLNFHHWLIKEE